MIVTFFLYLTSIVISLVLGLFVLFRNPRGAVNRIYFIFSLFASLWIFALYLLYSSSFTNVSILFAGRLSYVAGAGSVYLLYLLSRAFPRRIITDKIYVDILLGFETLILSVVTLFTDKIDAGESIVNDINITVFGEWFSWYTVHIVGIFLLVLILVYVKYLKLEKSEKSRLLLFFFGLIVAVLIAALTNLVLPLVGYSDFIAYGPLSVVVMVLTLSYAIVRHGLLDINSLVARTVTYALTLLAIVLIEAVVVVVGVRLLPDGIDKVTVAAAGAVIIVLGYDYLRRILNKFTERVFFQGRYNTEELLAKLTHYMASYIDIRKLSQKLLSTLVSEMKLTQGAILLIRDHKIIQIETVNWVENNSLRNIDVEELIHVDSKRLVFEELENGQIKEIFRELGIAVAMPLSTREGEIGLLLLGQKASGDIYAERDLELLTIFAPQAAVAISNAQAYQEIRDFSKTLEKKVDERTEELKSLQRQELEKANELLKIKDEFVFIATHDLATPVTAIAGFVDLLKASIRKVPKDLKEDIKAIDEATVRLRTLVNDLLEVARGESGTINLNLVPVDVNEIVKFTVKMLEKKIEAAKIKVKISIDQKNKMVLADKAKLSEVIENLLSNAVKYNKERGSVEVATTVERDALDILIKDTGIGIPEKEQVKVFSKFFRSESDETRRRSGTGLGLFVVRMLIEKMKGKISFSSSEGEGTEFVVTLKLAKAGKRSL